MLKRGAVITSLLAPLVLASVAVARVTRHVRYTDRQADISQTSTYPNPGSRAVTAGILRGPLGNGATVTMIKITGHPAATTYTFRGTATDFFLHGTIKSTLTGTARLNSNGSVSLFGRGRYTGGTGVYRRASGRYTYTASAPSPTGVLTAHTTATISY